MMRMPAGHAKKWVEKQSLEWIAFALPSPTSRPLFAVNCPTLGHFVSNSQPKTMLASFLIYFTHEERPECFVSLNSLRKALR